MQTGDDRSFGRIFGRHENAGFPGRPGPQGNRQDAFDRAHPAGQGQFADDDEIIQLIRFDLFAGGEHAQRDGQVKTWPFFFDVGGRQIDGGLAHGEFVAGIHEGGGNAVLGFLDGGVGQADERNKSFPVTAIDLHLHA